MPSLLNLLPNAVSQAQGQIVYGQVIAPVPTDFTHPLNVVMPDWSVEFSFVFATWPKANGVTLPAVGDDVLLVTDNRGERRVVWWGGTWSALSGNDWISPPLVNSWAAFGGGFPPPQYLKDPSGLVHPHGAAAGGATGTTAFVLPAGYRPGATYQGATVASGASFAYVIITTGGAVQPVGATVGTYVSFEITPFLAEN